MRVSSSFLFGSTAALIAVAAIAAEPVRTGETAFRSWKDDAPGVRRLIRPGDLPKPVMEDSASNSADKVRMPAGAEPKVPEGFAVELVASGLAQPRAMRTAPNGDLFVADSRANQIRVFRVPSGSAKPADKGIFATGLTRPYGIAFYPPGPDPEWVYVANSNSIVRFPYRNGDLEARGEAEVVVRRIPSNHHWT